MILKMSSLKHALVAGPGWRVKDGKMKASAAVAAESSLSILPQKPPKRSNSGPMKPLGLLRHRKPQVMESVLLQVLMRPVFDIPEETDLASALRVGLATDRQHELAQSAATELRLMFQMSESTEATRFEVPSVCSAGSAANYRALLQAQRVWTTGQLDAAGSLTARLRQSLKVARDTSVADVINKMWAAYFGCDPCLAGSVDGKDLTNLRELVDVPQSPPTRQPQRLALWHRLRYLHSFVLEVHQEVSFNRDNATVLGSSEKSEVGKPLFRAWKEAVAAKSYLGTSRWATDCYDQATRLLRCCDEPQSPTLAWHLIVFEFTRNAMLREACGNFWPLVWTLFGCCTAFKVVREAAARQSAVSHSEVQAIYDTVQVLLKEFRKHAEATERLLTGLANRVEKLEERVSAVGGASTRAALQDDRSIEL